MTSSTFTLDYNVTGADRKRLVQAISACVGTEPRYLGAPSFAYEVDYFTIDRNGSVSFDDRADSEEVEGLIETLAGQGFISAASETESEEVPEANGFGLTVTLPADQFTPDALNNLQAIIGAKGALIRKALGLEQLPVQVGSDTVSFPWFTGELKPDEVRAYTSFIAALCRMARESRRITAKEKDVDNDKYAFRCFLLRLGFIGADCKEDRKILLRKLSGSSAFKTAEAAERFNAAQKAKREAGKEAAECE